LVASFTGREKGPRGLSPALLVSLLAADRTIEMARLAQHLVPRSEAPWCRQASAGEDGPGPESLAGPLAIWSLTRAADDPGVALARAARWGGTDHGGTGSGRRGAAAGRCAGWLDLGVADEVAPASLAEDVADLLDVG
jgi:hypothetical protein